MPTPAEPDLLGLVPLLGLRMTAEEFLARPEDKTRYELIDGVVVMSPSPGVRHQRIAAEVFKQLVNHVDKRRLGFVFYEIDVLIGRGPEGRDLVYRPEMIFIRAERENQITERIRIVPDLIVEIVSPDSRSLDTMTKRDDYEQAGVGEYWIIDPERGTFTFYRLIDHRFVALDPHGDFFESQVVTDFRLDLPKVRAAFRSFC